MKSMSKSIFNLLFLFCTVAGVAQDATKKEQPKTNANDSVVKTEKYGLRIGADLSKLARSLYDKDYKGLELVGDFRVTKKMYLAAELGNENKTTDDDRLNFTTKGSYLKVGPEWNFYQNWLDMQNSIHLGFRYGVSSFSQELNSYKIYDPSGYFPPNSDVIAGKKYEGLSAHWTEVVAGMKAELFKNFYAGFSVRMNYLVTDKKPDNFDNLYIPGYNRTYDGKFGVGWNYTLTYSIPIYKKTTKTSTKPQKTAPKAKK
ncbi:DUF6048 family protein [Flavobacterium sp. GCM10027622]|uniref:DUF6048 family protein n=1 Tax=unclassified Flavobacterium TaxID=196869 RepID=UPI00360E57C0